MPEFLEIGFRFTLALEGRLVAQSHVDTDDIPRITAIAFHIPPRPCSTQGLWISWMRLGGVGFQLFFSFAIMLAAWLSPKDLSASSGLPSLAQAAWSRLCISRVLKVRHGTNWSAVRRRSTAQEPESHRLVTGGLPDRLQISPSKKWTSMFWGKWRSFDQAWSLWKICSTDFHLLCRYLPLF